MAFANGLVLLMTVGPLCSRLPLDEYSDLWLGTRRDLSAHQDTTPRLNSAVAILTSITVFSK